ncbi:hypothetical protein LY78DRAFT_593063, partial [Colletotrichum sublineola]
LTGLSMGERMGSRIIRWVWSYVLVLGGRKTHLVGTSILVTELALIKNRSKLKQV